MTCSRTPSSESPRGDGRELRTRIASLERRSGPVPAQISYLPFGLAPIDWRLPGGGLRLGAVHEITPAQAALAHAPACTLFAAGIRARTRLTQMPRQIWNARAI